MNRTDILQLVVALTVVELNSNKKVIGLVERKDDGRVIILNSLKVSGDVTSKVMAEYLVKAQKELLSDIEIGQASYQITKLEPNQVVDFKAAAEKFCNLMEIAANNMAADYAASHLGEF